MRKTTAAMVMAVVTASLLLLVMVRNDLGESRFYGTLQTAAIVLVVIVLGVAVAVYSLALIHVKGEAQAKIEAARRPLEKHIYHERTHTLDGRGTFNVAGGDPLAYPDLVRGLLATQAQPGAVPQLNAGIPVQLPRQPQAAPAQRLEDVAPLVDEEPAWTPYAGMAGEW